MKIKTQSRTMKRIPRKLKKKRKKERLAYAVIYAEAVITSAKIWELRMKREDKLSKHIQSQKNPIHYLNEYPITTDECFTWNIQGKQIKEDTTGPPL